jgi:hypothetical protein
MEQQSTAFVRKIVHSGVLEQVLPLPPSFRGVQVEVIILPLETQTPGAAPAEKKKSAYGRLKAYANPALIPEENGAWERAAAQKYALH